MYNNLKTLTIMDKFRFARKIEDTINDCSFNAKNTAYYMAYKCHRALQQSFFKLALNFIELCARNYEKGIYDGRNEWACQMSKKIIDGIKNDKMYWPTDFSDVED